MMEDLKDIWSNGKGKLSEEKLLAYLEGKLSAAEQHEVEMWLSEEGMESDATEGLSNLPANEAQRLVKSLNYDLNKKLKTKTRRRTKPLKNNRWTWIAIVIVLILCILSFLLVHFSINK